MRNILHLFVFTIFISTPIFAQTLIQYVNPFIGTGGHGHTFPGATLPFGGCQLSPDTRLEGWDGCSGYHYSDSVIYGFSHTHLSGTGCSDYGDILLMPVTQNMELNKYQYQSTFSHKNEMASAGFYSVFLDQPKVQVNLTATLHGGIHQYIYPEKSEQYVVLDLKHRDEVLDSKMEVVDAYTLRGYRFSKAWASNQKLFYEIKFSKPFFNEKYSLSSHRPYLLKNKNIIELFKFENDGKPLMVKVAISGVDEKGAHQNLLKEMPNWDFEQYKIAAQKTWEKELNKIKISGNTDDKKTIFYTALYHAMIHPSIYSDVDGRYRGRDDKIHSTEGKFDYYTVFSLWDTYRALHPLLTIIDKKRTNDFINTFIKQYEQGGRLPIWELSSNETNCMIGYHVVSVIWDAYNKGIRNYDVPKAFEAMKSIATSATDYVYSPETKLEQTKTLLSLKPEAAKRCANADALLSYNKYGYVQADDDHESVSKTLEYAYDDWCIAQMANALKMKDDYEYYINRSQYWKNVYDPTTGFMRARKNGTLYEPFSPYTVDNNYTEANSWQYSFSVPHDVEGLVKRCGGETAFEKKLDDLFTAKQQTEGREQADITGLLGQYAQGNEPSHHIAYLYNEINKPEKTNFIIDSICNHFYKNEPDGLIGNEDCGQMSAWYVMSAMGKYQLCPGIQKYITTPSLFKNELFEKLNNSKNEHKTNLSIVANPFILKANETFKGSQKIEIQNVEKEAELFYILNKQPVKKYTEAFTISENTDLYFYAQKGVANSPLQEAHFYKLPDDRTVTLKSIYNKSYSGGGPEALIDGIYGKLNWRSGDWQGYQGQDFEAVISFNKAKNLNHITAHFLQDQNAWIFYPKQVSFFYSTDSTHWTLIETVDTKQSDHDLTVSLLNVESFHAIKDCKYIKVMAKSFGKMPEWHEGRGYETFIFIDEIKAE